MAQQINIIIGKDGGLTSNYNGYVGDACMAEAQRMAEALAKLGITLDVTEIVRKPETVTENVQNTVK